MRYFTDLVNDIKAGRFAPVYLFYGPESYLRREAVKRIRDLFLPGGPGDINYTALDGEESSLSNIVSLAAMTPLFAEKRLVVVKNAKYFSGKTGAGDRSPEEPPDTTRPEDQALLKYLAGPAPSTCLIFDTGYSVDKRKNIYKELARTGKAIEFSLLKTAELTTWLEKQARLAGKVLAPGAAADILARCGNNLESLSMEIQKLISYAGDSGAITAEDVAAVTPPFPGEDIFAVVDAIGERNPARAVSGIGRLIMLKQPPPVILAMVARQFRLIIRAGEAVRSGTVPGQLASQLGIHPFVAKKIAAQQKNFDRQGLVEIMQRLHKLDVAVKSGQQDFLAGMEMLILDICRP